MNRTSAHAATLESPAVVPGRASAPALLDRVAALLLPGWHRRRRLCAAGGLDPETGLANARGLALLAPEALDGVRRMGRPLAVVVLEFEELHEMRDLYGEATAKRVLGHVARRMRELGGPVGLAARTGRDQFTVLLPGANQQSAWEIVERVLGRPSRVEFDAGRDEIVLVPEIAAEHVARDGETVVDVWRELAGDLAQRRHYEQRRRTWLRRERERHSRPMPLA